MFYDNIGTLFFLWLIVAFIVGFAQNHHTNTLLEPSTWITCLFLFISTGIFLYIQVIHFFVLSLNMHSNLHHTHRIKMILLQILQVYNYGV